MDAKCEGAHNPSIMYTKIIGRMSGEAFPVRFFATEKEREDWFHANGPSSVKDGILLPVISESEYYQIIQSGKSAEFLMYLG